MSYLVFARKWRPQVFEEVIGQEHITTTLKNALKSGRIAHAYLFTGPRGIGKTSTARILAKALNCEKGPTPTPCNKCASCKEITNSISLDVLEIDGASNTSVDQIRDLRENVKLSPSLGKFKVYIIDEVHMLSTSAFNALLKTLEEPPPHVKFIFATTQAHKVLPTIISRCQRFDFRRIPMQDIILKLKKISKQEKIDIEEEALFNIACASDGSMRDAESILDQLISYKKGKIKSSDVTSLLGMVEAEIYFDFSQKIVHKDTAGILRLINHIILEGKDLHQFISGLIEHFRNLIILKVAEDLKPLVHQTQENIKKLSELSKNFSQQDLLYSFSVLVATQQMMRQSPNMRIPLEVAAVKLTHISQLKSLPQILEEIKNLDQNESASNDFETQILNSKENKNPSPGPLSETKEKKEEKEKSIIPSTALREPAKDPLGSPLEEEINSHWPAFLENIKNESLLVGLYLSESKVLKIEGNHLFIGFHNEGNFHIDYLQKRENKNLIEKKLSELIERKIRVSFVKLEEKAKENPPNKKAEVKKTSPVDSIIDSAIKIFGGRIIKNR